VLMFASRAHTVKLGTSQHAKCLPSCCKVPQSDTWCARELTASPWTALHHWLQVISVELPNTVELEVVETDPGVRGNTAVSWGPLPASS
jgi:hypothetical protein